MVVPRLTPSIAEDQFFQQAYDHVIKVAVALFTQSEVAVGQAEREEAFRLGYDTFMRVIDARTAYVLSRRLTEGNLEVINDDTYSSTADA